MESWELEQKMTDNMHSLNNEGHKTVMVSAATYLDAAETVQAFKDGFEAEDFEKLRAAFEAAG